MSNQRAEEFLDLYRRLENASERLMGTDSRSSSIMKLARHRDFGKYRDELDYARQVRNLLTHEAKLNGQYGVVPSDNLLTFMEKLVNRLENPPVVSHVMTPVDHLVTVKAGQKVLALMEEMEGRGISHVPLLKNGRVQGVFSTETVFCWNLHQNPPFTADTTIEELAEYLPLSAHHRHGYAFVPPFLPLSDARNLVDKAYNRNCKMKLLLITHNGQENGNLLGVVSPYDLLEKE